MKATFGECVKKLKTNKGLTLTQLAFQLDLDSADLSEIKNGKREFGEKRLEKLVTPLNLDIDRPKRECFATQFVKKMHQYDYSPNTLIRV